MLRGQKRTMAGKNIITINGRSYDAVTGSPIAPAHARQPEHHAPSAQQPSPKPHKAFSDISGPARIHTPPTLAATTPQHKSSEHPDNKAHTIHQQPQKSQTLYRAALKKPMPLRQLEPAPVKVADYDTASAATYPAISHFNSRASGHHAEQAVIAAATPERAPRVHPIVAKALSNQPVAAPPEQPQTSRELKEALIRERLAEAQPNGEHHRAHRQPRLATILTSSLALLLLAGYLTYINLPNISMRVAATRAGIAANYPNYSPDGYHFAGPITYQPGEVNITFKSNTNNDRFDIQQKASSWDNQAVLDNYVSKQTGTYLTYEEHGLTIYSYGDHAAWVNGGLLYTIDGDAPLSSDELLRIATSM